MESKKPTLGEIYNSLVDEYHVKFLSVSCLNMLMQWIDVNRYYRNLATEEVKRRFSAMNRSIVRKGLSPYDFPFQVTLSDFREDACNVVRHGNEIDLNGMKMILKFLRHFGDELYFINCNFYGASEEQVFTVFTYITRYCTNLRKLYFGYLRHSLSYSLRRTFDQVTELFFLNCRLDKELCNLAIHFPRVREISFYERNEFQNLDRVVVTYPHLRRMIIESASIDILSVALLKAINPGADIAYLGMDLNVMVLNL